MTRACPGISGLPSPNSWMWPGTRPCKTMSCCQVMSRKSLCMTLAQIVVEQVIGPGSVLLLVVRGPTMLLLALLPQLLSQLLTMQQSRKERRRQGVTVGSVYCERTGTPSTAPRSRRCGLPIGSSGVKLSRTRVSRTELLHWRSLEAVLNVLHGATRSLNAWLLHNAGT